MYKGTVVDGLKEGFVIAPFDIATFPVLTITSLCEAEWALVESLVSGDGSVTHIFNMPEVSTSETQHEFEVENIIKELKTDLTSKTIAARAICNKGHISIEKTFESFCYAFPDAFVFTFYTPLSGAWIGASPELLLKGNESGFDTIALAGTRPSGEVSKWDEKNIREQAIVAKYIEECFINYGLKPTLSTTKSHKAGNVEHLMTEIHGDSLADETDLFSFLKNLSPTPALCGYPKKESIDRINRLESFDRGFYGGFCGIYNSVSDFTFYVILRSVMFNAGRWCIISGGGITSDSEPHSEWLETERKASGIIERLRFND